MKWRGFQLDTYPGQRYVSIHVQYMLGQEGIDHLFPAVGLKCRTRTKGRDTGDLAQLCKIPGEIFHNASFLLKGVQRVRL